MCEIRDYFIYFVLPYFFFFQECLHCFNVIIFTALPSKPEEEGISNGVAGKKLVKSEDDKDSKKSKSTDINEDDELEFIEKSLPKKTNVNQFDESADSFSSEQQTKTFKTNSVTAAKSSSSGNKINSSKENSTKKAKNYMKEAPPATFSNNKDETISRYGPGDEYIYM